MGKLDGKVAIVTGGSAGIGRGIARAFARAGADLAICSRRPDKLELAAAELQQLGGRVLHLACDVMEKAQIADFVGAVERHFGRIDVLVNNACTMPSKQSFESIDDVSWMMPWKSGVQASFHFMKMCFPSLKARGGKVINMASLTGTRGLAGNGAYGAAKAAIVAMSRIAAIDWAPYSINVNCISPFAMSEALEEYMKTVPDELKGDPFSAIGLSPPPIARAGDPERDIGAAALFLACGDSDYITGHVLPVDGGMSELSV